MEGPGLDTGQALPALSMLSGQGSNSFLTVAERPQALPLPAAFIPVTEHSALPKRSHAGTGAGAGAGGTGRPEAPPTGSRCGGGHLGRGSPPALGGSAGGPRRGAAAASKCGEDTR